MSMRNEELLDCLPEILKTFPEAIDPSSNRPRRWGWGYGQSFDWDIFQEVFLENILDHRVDVPFITLDEERQQGVCLFMYW